MGLRPTKLDENGAGADSVLWSLRCPAGAPHGPPRTSGSSSDRSLREIADSTKRSLRQPRAISSRWFFDPAALPQPNGKAAARKSGGPRYLLTRILVRRRIRRRTGGAHNLGERLCRPFLRKGSAFPGPLQSKSRGWRRRCFLCLRQARRIDRPHASGGWPWSSRAWRPA